MEGVVNTGPGRQKADLMKGKNLIKASRVSRIAGGQCANSLLFVNSDMQSAKILTEVATLPRFWRQAEKVSVSRGWVF